MRIRTPFAAGFVLLCLAAAYIGLTPLQLGEYVNDKVLHLVTFFLLTIVFYWIVDTNRRRTLHLTLVVCTVILGIGSEFVQAMIPNGREFDLYDIVANAVGSLLGLGLCSWYHKRMLERKRQRRQYENVAGEDDADVELGEGVFPQEEGVDSGVSGNHANRDMTLEEEVDNWDENALDAWDEDDEGVESTGAGGGPKGRKD